MGILSLSFSMPAEEEREIAAQLRGSIDNLALELRRKSADLLLAENRIENLKAILEINQMQQQMAIAQLKAEIEQLQAIIAQQEEELRVLRSALNEKTLP
jgi:uncharacterized protein YqfA (UPF0365 family)